MKESTVKDGNLLYKTSALMEERLAKLPEGLKGVVLAESKNDRQYHGALFALDRALSHRCSTA